MSSAASPSLTASVSCPGGRLVLGGGWTIEVKSANDSSAEIVVTSSAPTSDNEWTVTAAEASNVANWSLQAHAVCAAVSP